MVVPKLGCSYFWVIWYTPSLGDLHMLASIIWIIKDQGFRTASRHARCGFREVSNCSIPSVITSFEDGGDRKK